MVNMRHSVFVGICVLLSAQLFAADTAGTRSMTFLKMLQGARPAGMGEAYTAVADDTMALYVNPAGICIEPGYDWRKGNNTTGGN